MLTRTVTTMNRQIRPCRWFASLLLLAALLQIQPARSQDYSAAELEDLVAPVALYPDDVLGIILPASTFPLDIVRAARFLDEREADATLEPDPAWDDSIVALLNYPEVVRMLDENLDWTWALGEAVLTDQAAVLAAAQDFRSQAYAAGNLQSDDKQTVTQADGTIEIRPANPEVVYIPVYEPREVVVFQPAPIWHYYPVAYPLYYYPYPVGYHFGYGGFWGVSSYFAIGWHSHYLHVHHHTHYGHPYYLSSYYSYAPYYPRTRVNVTIVENNYNNVWAPGPRRGDRPRTVTSEGRASAPRTTRTASSESQPNAAARMRSQSAGEPRSSSAAPRASTGQQRASSDQQRASSGQQRTGSGEPSPQPRSGQPATRSSGGQSTMRPGTIPQSGSRATAPSQRSDAASQGSGVTSQRSGAPSQRSGVTSQRSGATNQRSATTSQRSGATSQRSPSSTSSLMGGSGTSGNSAAPRAQGTTRSGSSAASSSSSGSRTRQR